LATNPAIWGKLLAAVPQRESELRPAIRKAAQLSPEEELFWVTEFHPFGLRFPEDNVLLPHVLYALLRNLHQEQLEIPAKVNGVNSTVAKMIDDPSKLPVANESPPIRCAALFLALFHPSRRSEFSSLLKQIVEGYDASIPSWYFDAFIASVTLFSSEEDATTKTLIGNLLDQVRNDYAARRHIDPLFVSWREASYSPVNMSGVMTKWLAGD
jgi:hypothetical protein